MTARRDQPPIEPDSVTDWSEWGRQQGARWGSWGKEFGARAQTWSSEARSGARPDAPPQPAALRLLWQIVSIPSAILGFALVLALALVGLLAVLVGGAIAAWLAMGIGSGAIAARHGYPRPIGSLLGFALGPIRLFLVTRLPQRA